MSTTFIYSLDSENLGENIKLGFKVYYFDVYLRKSASSDFFQNF